MTDRVSSVVVLTVEAALRDDTVLVVINVPFTVNKSVVCELSISPGTVPVIVTAVVVVVVDEVVCELLISLGRMLVVSTAVAVLDVVGNITVVIVTSVVSLGAFLVDASGAVVEVSSVPVLVTMVAGCTEVDLVGIGDKADDNSSVE